MCVLQEPGSTEAQIQVRNKTQ